VGRTLLSAAFDFVFDLGLNLTSILNNKSNTRVKSGGQECPPHMGSEAQHYWFGFEAYGPEFFDPLLDLIFQREDFGSGGSPAVHDGERVLAGNADVAKAVSAGESGLLD